MNQTRGAGDSRSELARFAITRSVARFRGLNLWGRLDPGAYLRPRAGVPSRASRLG